MIGNGGSDLIAITDRDLNGIENHAIEIQENVGTNAEDIETVIAKERWSYNGVFRRSPWRSAADINIAALNSAIQTSWRSS